MVSRVTRSEMSRFKIKIKSPLWLLVGYSLVTTKHSRALVLHKSKATIFSLKTIEN